MCPIIYTHIKYIFLETFCGHSCMVNIFGEFEDIEKQLENVKEHLNNMVFKNLKFDYIGDVFVKALLSHWVHEVFSCFHHVKMPIIRT